LDDVAPLLRAWEALVLALASLDRDLLRQGLIKDEEVCAARAPFGLMPDV
jgi:hypothetical protein